MRVAVECKSPLLQKSLEIFLVKYISSRKLCDIIIRDEECLNDEKCFFISCKIEADLQKPFSKSQLILALENKYESLGLSDTTLKQRDTVMSEEPLNFEILENRIEYLTREYQQNIIKAVKAFYEK